MVVQYLRRCIYTERFRNVPYGVVQFCGVLIILFLKIPSSASLRSAPSPRRGEGFGLYRLLPPSDEGGGFAAGKLGGREKIALENTNTIVFQNLSLSHF